MTWDIWPYLPGFLAACAILFVGSASPGPAVAFLVGVSVGRGRGAGSRALGVFLGFAAFKLATART